MFNPNEHLMDLKGKQYLQVMWRLVWFRDEKPNWGIDTHLEQLGDNFAVFSAKIYDENGVLKAAGYGSESVKDFRDYIEKAETKAIGRALAMLGYGTQFAPELEEGERIVDSPVAPAIPHCDACGDTIKAVTGNDGKSWTVPQLVSYSRKNFGNHVYCAKCMHNAKAAQDAG